MELSPVPIGIGPVPGGGACNRELRRIPLLRTTVNKGKKEPSVKTRLRVRLGLSLVPCAIHFFTEPRLYQLQPKGSSAWLAATAVWLQAWPGLSGGEAKTGKAVANIMATITNATVKTKSMRLIKRSLLSVVRGSSAPPVLVTRASMHTHKGRGICQVAISERQLRRIPRMRTSRLRSSKKFA